MSNSKNGYVFAVDPFDRCVYVVALNERSARGMVWDFLKSTKIEDSVSCFDLVETFPPNRHPIGILRSEF